MSRIYEHARRTAILVVLPLALAAGPTVSHADFHNLCTGFVGYATVTLTANQDVYGDTTLDYDGRVSCPGGSSATIFSVALKFLPATTVDATSAAVACGETTLAAPCVSGGSAPPVGDGTYEVDMSFQVAQGSTVNNKSRTARWLWQNGVLIPTCINTTEPTNVGLCS